jgi:hypothetical protein
MSTIYPFYKLVNDIYKIIVFGLAHLTGKLIHDLMPIQNLSEQI